jgi:hypothetical protein
MIAPDRCARSVLGVVDACLLLCYAGGAYIVVALDNSSIEQPDHEVGGLVVFVFQ